MIIRGKEFDTKNRTYIMAILNLTPDSFSDGGKYSDRDSILKRVAEMVKEGADILDIGAESTRPGHVRISDEEEIERLLPALEYIRKEYDLPISVDTYKHRVAEEALKSGCDIINDIWGLKADPEMASVISRSGAACVLMHNSDSTDYEDLIADCKRDIKESVDLALKAGIDKEKIIIDPGIGFGKTCEQNLKVMKHLSEFAGLGYPLLLGASRKSFIGLTLDLPVDERLDGTLASSVVAVMSGCSFVRVHDVKENLRAVKLAMAIRDA